MICLFKFDVEILACLKGLFLDKTFFSLKSLNIQLVYEPKKQTFS